MTYQIFKFLSDSKNEYVSGESLAKKLNVTRAAINKHIMKLKQMGFEIQSHTNLGYRIFRDSDILNEYSLRYALEHFNHDGVKVKFEPSVTSTITEGKWLDFNGTPILFCAERQVAGKGRRGRNFVSDINGAYFSVIVSPKHMDVTKALKSVLVCGICVVEMLRDYGIDAKLKYPNDVEVNGKKICGILCEMVCNIDFVERLILGIGVNVNNKKFPDELQAIATSMSIEKDDEFIRSVIIANITSRILNYIKHIEVNGFALTIEEYKKYSSTLGNDVSITELDNSVYYGKAVDLDYDGFLIVQTEDGKRRVVSGDVSVRKMK